MKGFCERLKNFDRVKNREYKCWFEHFYKYIVENKKKKFPIETSHDFRMLLAEWQIER